MKFDDFIQCCVMLRSLTEGFKRLDTNQSGTITINYEQVSTNKSAVIITLLASLSPLFLPTVPGDGH